MEMNNIITPGTGYGALKFGQKRAEVENILGKPDEIETAEDADGLEYWHYDDLDLSLVFDETEMMRLSTIVTANPEMMLYGQFLSRMNRLELIDFLKKKGHKKITVDENIEDDLQYVTIEVDDIEMLFWLKEDIVTEVQFGPFFLDEETINWPK